MTGKFAEETSEDTSAISKKEKMMSLNFSQQINIEIFEDCHNKVDAAKDFAEPDVDENLTIDEVTSIKLRQGNRWKIYRKQLEISRKV